MRAPKNPYWNWFGFWTDSMFLALEAPQVMALRMAKLSQAGTAAQAEAARMVAEKAQAAVLAGFMGAEAIGRGRRDCGAAQVMKMYRRKVSANRARLSKRPKAK